MDWPSVTCPSCFEVFQVPPPSAGELPSSVDYDCEICCRPMVLDFSLDLMGGIEVHARSLDE